MVRGLPVIAVSFEASLGLSAFGGVGGGWHRSDEVCEAIVPRSIWPIASNEIRRGVNRDVPLDSSGVRV